MLINDDAIHDPATEKFLVLERWGGLDNAASYREQAQSLRRSLDSIEYMEKAYTQAIVASAHKPTMYAGLVAIVSAHTNAELDAYSRRNAAHARMAHQDREVLPLRDWDDGREELAALIRQMETLAAVERTANEQGTLRPLDER